jgi:hypothetical protein
MNKKEKLHIARLQHIQWLKSIGVNASLEDVSVYQKPKNTPKEGELDLSYLKVKNSIPCGNRIGGTTKKRYYTTHLPAGKTISVAYNKGPYMIVDAKDFKTMGRKI